MNFSLTDTQIEIRELATRIFRDHTTQERLRQLDRTGYFDEELWRSLASVGLLGLALDEAHGGMGMDFETLAVVLQECGRFVAPVPLVATLVSGALTLQCCTKDSDAQALVAPLLKRLASGEALMTAALPAAKRTAKNAQGVTAVQVNRNWTLSGIRSAVPCADKADHAWVSASCADGMGIFLLDLHATGVAVERQTLTSGEYAGRLVLNHAPADLLAVGQQALDWVATAETLTWAAQAAWATGACAEMVLMGSTYTTERVQFGKPIATFQAVAHQLADACIDTECLRAVSIQASCRLSTEGYMPASAREAALVAKVWAADALHRVSHKVQQVHGGAGVDRDYPLFRYAMAAKQAEVMYGGRETLLPRLEVF